MTLQHILQRQVDDHIAVGQHRILLPDAAQVIAHAAKSLHLAPELAAVLPMLGIGEDHSAKTILALGYPMYAVLSVYLAYRVYADRREVSWLLIALVWLSLAAEWWLVFGAK